MATTRGTFRLALKDVEGGFLQETTAKVAFFRALDNQQLGDPRRIDFSHGPVNFSLEAFPAGPYYCEITPERYRMLKSSTFRITAGQVTEEEQTTPRDAGQWQSRFVPWGELAGPFDPLRNLLAGGEVRLFEGGSSLGTLAGDAYDAVAGGAAGLAKTSLLNLYYKLTALREPVAEERSWFSFVRRVLAIGRERVIAIAGAELATVVRHVLENMTEYREHWHAAEDAEGHRANLPEEFRSRVTEMLSIKSNDFEASLQVTVGFIPGADFATLDADIDEHGELLHHGFDWVTHWFTGGTHPYDVHEFLVKLARDAGKAIDLGYTLV